MFIVPYCIAANQSQFAIHMIDIEKSTVF